MKLQVNGYVCFPKGKKKKIKCISMAEHGLFFRTGQRVLIFSSLEFVPLRVQEKIRGEERERQKEMKDVSMLSSSSCNDFFLHILLVPSH